MPSTESKLLGDDGHDALHPFSETIRFQSSRPHLKRFMMLDQIGGKARVFFHPDLAQDMFGLQSGRNLRENHNASGSGEHPKKASGPSDTEEANAKLQAFRQTVSAAFASLQSLRNSRQSDIATAIIRPLKAGLASPTNSAGASGTKGVSTQENSEELDALLSSAEEDEEDEEVRSTGHSPDQTSMEESYESEGEEQSSKRVRAEHHHLHHHQQHLRLHQNQAAMAKSREEEGDDPQQQEPIRGRSLHPLCSSKKLKIKRTVKTLRRMIPGGSCMDPAFVLDQTILYVKTLRDRVHQLETSRFPSLP